MDAGCVNIPCNYFYPMTSTILSWDDNALENMVHLYISFDPFRSESALLFNDLLCCSLLASALATRPSASTVGGLRMIATTLQRGDISQRLKCKTKGGNTHCALLCTRWIVRAILAVALPLGTSTPSTSRSARSIGGSSAPRNTSGAETKTYAQLVLV